VLTILQLTSAEGLKSAIKMKDYHPWDQYLPYDNSKKIFYFKNPIHHSNSTYEVLGDHIYEKVQDLPEN